MVTITQQIIVNDENHVRIGVTFPKRAKQLIKKNKAKWTDEAQTEISLISAEERTNAEMEINDIANKLFKDTPKDSDDSEAKDEFIASLNKKYEALVNDGIDAENTLHKVVTSLDKKRSIVKEAYKDSAYAVLRSSPIELIKKSKRRTRELHTAFSLVLWTGTAILYFGINYILGYTDISLNLTNLPWTWLVFVFAMLIECTAEIYFCRKELEVLSENIDLRQINPSTKVSDIDLKEYQRKLTNKIMMMSFAVRWVPLVIIYFVCGYAAGLWGVAWIVFVLGAFFELLLNFYRKLKG